MPVAITGLRDDDMTGLRVVVFPTITSGNITAPIVVPAWLAADRILKDNPA